MMRTDVKQVVVYFENGSKALFDMEHGSMTKTGTRIKGRVVGNPDKFTEVSQLSVHGEIKRPPNDAAPRADLPESIPETPEEVPE